MLDNLSDVLFILDEVRVGRCRKVCKVKTGRSFVTRQMQVTDNGVIMETDDEKISARIKMIDETEVTQSAQAGRGRNVSHLLLLGKCSDPESPRKAEQMFQKATQSPKLRLTVGTIG